jgi:protocatechuate 4,5-dioxygenase, alpha chain
MTTRQIDPERLPHGTYLNTGESAARAMRVNRLCYDLRDPRNREAFLADPEKQMDKIR